MAKFLVLHPIGGEIGDKSVGQAIKAALTPEAYWIRSMFVKELGMLFCEWDGKDVESIRQVLTQAAPDFPTEGVYPIEMTMDSEMFR